MLLCSFWDVKAKFVLIFLLLLSLFEVICHYSFNILLSWTSDPRFDHWRCTDSHIFGPIISLWVPLILVELKYKKGVLLIVRLYYGPDTSAYTLPYQIIHLLSSTQPQSSQLCIITHCYNWYVPQLLFIDYYLTWPVTFLT